MTYTNYWKLGFITIAIFVSLVLVMSRPQEGNANPSSTTPIKTTGTGSDATTTQTYMSTGVGTTTIALDTYSGGVSAVYDSMMVSLILTSTSTINNPAVNMRLEYALGKEGLDCSTNQSACDWFPFNVNTTANASTSVMTQNYSDYKFQISTSTAYLDSGGSSYYAAPTSTFMTSAQITSPARYIRVKFYVPVAGGRGSLWAALLPLRQRP